MSDARNQQRGNWVPMSGERCDNEEATASQIVHAERRRVMGCCCGKGFPNARTSGLPRQNHAEKQMYEDLP